MNLRAVALAEIETSKGKREEEREKAGNFREEYEMNGLSALSSLTVLFFSFFLIKDKNWDGSYLQLSCHFAIFNTEHPRAS
jgi:hypothetical protein